MYRPAAHIQDDELYLPAGQLGMGWWGDAWDEVKSVAKKVQANPVVRGLEKKAVDYGSKALRGAAGLRAPWMGWRTAPCRPSARPNSRPSIHTSGP